MANDDSVGCHDTTHSLKQPVGWCVRDRDDILYDPN